MSSPEQMTAPNSFSAAFSAGLKSRGQEPKQGSANMRRNLNSDLRADYVFANPPFNDSDTALCDCVFLQSEAKMKVVSEAKYNFRSDENARRQWSGATWTTKGSQQDSLARNVSSTTGNDS